MKNQITTLVIILFITAGFVGCRKSDTNHLITVDVTKSYPEKELILQDFMDVEYIPLETNDEFVTDGVVMALGDKFIVTKKLKPAFVDLLKMDAAVKVGQNAIV